MLLLLATGRHLRASDVARGLGIGPAAAHHRLGLLVDRGLARCDSSGSRTGEGHHYIVFAGLDHLKRRELIA